MWPSACMKVSGNLKVSVQCGLGINPDTEEADFAVVFLAPLAVIVSRQWK